MSQLNDDGSSLFGSAERLRKELEKLLDRAKDQGERALDAIGLKGGAWQPAADIVETADDVLVVLDIPGVTADHVSVEIVGNILSVSGTRTIDEPGSGEIVHVRQRLAGKFSKSVPMPVPVNHEQVGAEIHNGVLTVRLAKSEKAKAHKVPIVERSI